MGLKSNTGIILLYMLSGMLIGLSVNTLGFIPLSPLAWIGFLPLLYAIRRSAPWRIHITGIYVFSVIKLLLCLFSFVSVFIIPGLILIFMGGIISGIPLCLYFIIQQKFGWHKALFALPFLWTAYIAIVSDAILAMPILSFSVGQASLPWLIQFIDLTGHTAIVFWVLMLNVLVALGIDSWNQHKLKLANASHEIGFLVKRVGLVVLGMFLPPLMYSFYSFHTLPDSFTSEIHVGLVQPGFSNYGSDADPDFVTNLFYAQVDLTDSLIANHNVDLIIWPESAIAIPLLEDSNAVRAIFQKVLQWETPLLTGTFDRDFYTPDEKVPNLQQYLGRNYDLFNSAMMITPQLAWMHLQENLPLNSVKMYHKTNLMPFTEYVPLSETFPVLSNASVFRGGYSHYSSGESLEYLTFAAQNQVIYTVSPMICWDLLSTGSSKSAVDTGSQFVAALTNESALGDRFRVTVYEMESYTRLRSIESRRSIAKAALTGYTFFTNPFGQVYGLVPWWSPQISVETVILTDFHSIYTRYPHAYTILNLLGLFFVLYRVSRVSPNKTNKIQTQK